MEPGKYLSVSPGRRVVGAFAPFGLGVIFASLAVQSAGASLPVALGFALLAFGAAWIGIAVWRAGAEGIEIVDGVIRTRAGREICRVDQIVAVERGAFAFKPSGGFLLRLQDPAPRAWVPGLWWRLGRMVGIGGITRSAEARLMADLLQLGLTGR